MERTNFVRLDCPPGQRLLNGMTFQVLNVKLMYEGPPGALMCKGKPFTKYIC